MMTKIHNLNELEHIFSSDNKPNEGIPVFFKAFNIRLLLEPFEKIKSKGISVSALVLMLCVIRLRGLSIWGIQMTDRRNLFGGDENSFYRLMNNSSMNWRKLLMSFAKQFVAIAQAKGDNDNGIKCFVIDDTDIEKTGKTMEFIGKVYNHVTHRCTLGYKMLALGYWDGKSLIAADFSLHREAGKSGNYGMTKKELKRQFGKKRDKASPAFKRVGELDIKKTEVAISMIKRAVKNGMKASYVLMDSWFVNDYIIKSIRSIKKSAMHVLGMCKMDKRKYSINGKELNSAQITTLYARKKGKYSRKHKSHYFTVTVQYKGETVKLFYIKYRNAKNWTLLLTTDLSLNFVQALEIYQIRWGIEVLFKECKQYLRLGSSQNTDFDGQIADTTLTLITHTVLSLQKRFEAYETMGGLFRETQQHLIELTLWERILEIFIKLLHQLVEILNIDIEETMETIMQNDKKSKQLLSMLNALKDWDNPQLNNKNAS
jgi:hypothetical protein